LYMVFACCWGNYFSQNTKLRPLADTIGFASTPQQMDAVMERIIKTQSGILKKKQNSAGITKNTIWKTVIAPHDDYTYTGYLYPLALQNIKAKTVIIFGVAHKAKNLNLEDQVIFDSYTHWRAPYGKVKVSSLREDIIDQLPKEVYQINDSMQRIEHSVEAEIPFLQYYNKQVEIISILVPYMNYEKMDEIAGRLSKAIFATMNRRKLKWGEDVAIVISADAVHYGDEDWGGRNFAFYGADSSGYKKAVDHEYEIMNSCFKGTVDPGKIKKFTQYTVEEKDHKAYKWTWCGRYSVPMGVLTSYKLSFLLNGNLSGTILGYGTSIENKHIPVGDLGTMGVTAKSDIHHWVGYPAIGFK
jgi:AmmeMemoRadiSam system protein B